MAESNDTGEKSVFEEETKHRTFKIIVEDKIFFVNPSFLAERSPFFETLLFGDFKEKKEGKAELKDVKAKDFEEFLLVLGADAKHRKKIDASNFVVLANFSHLWDMDILREECIMFIDSEFALLAADAKAAVEIAAACETIRVPTATQKTIATKLGQYPYIELKKNKAHMVVGSLVATAAFLASKTPENCVCGLSKKSAASTCCYTGCHRNQEDDSDDELCKFNVEAIRLCHTHSYIANKWSKQLTHGKNQKMELFVGTGVDDELFSTE